MGFVDLLTTQALSVSIANHQTPCHRLTICLPELTVQEDFLPLELGVDMILEMQWLQTMGFMGVDWVGLTMSFQQGGNKVIIKGDSLLTKTEISLKMLNRRWSSMDQGNLADLRGLNR